MPSFTRPIAMPAPFVRSVAIAALMGSTMLVAPLTAALAGSAISPQIRLAQAATTGSPATETKGETVEQRITSLHSALKITPAEDAKWNDVAQAMRENAATMDKLVANTRTTAPQSMTAVQDLQNYRKFAQAHVDGLKNLISSFEDLYNSMPDPQKKLADEVFQNHAQAKAASRG